MPNFLLIDHSLKDRGSHHFEYAYHLLKAAEDQQYKITLATHRRFAEKRQLLPAHWKLLPFFPHHTYSKFSAMRPAGQARKPVRGWWSTPTPKSLAEYLSQHWNRFQQRARVHAFADACREVWREQPLKKGDLAFVPTLSDHDLMGLVEFLASEESTRAVDWHLQFHFKFLKGRPPEYADQQITAGRLAEHFRTTLGALRHHRLHFYSTTEELTEQFNRLQIGDFQLLPYLADPSQRRVKSTGPSRLPLRVTCAGNIREEKGQRHLAPIVDEVWESHFVSGKIQLLTQSGGTQFVLRPSHADPASEMTANDPTESAAPIVHLQHPLTAESYKELIRRSDIGLFLYDSRAYYGRAAGILVEMLMCGVPVIVPAGSWLGEQVSEPIQLHLDKLRISQEAVRHLYPNEIAWSLSDDLPTVDLHSEKVLRVGRRGATTRFEIPAGAGDLLVGLRFAKGTERGHYLRVELRQFDSEGRKTAQHASLLGPRANGAWVGALQHLQRGATHAELTLQNAYGSESLCLHETEVRFLPFADGKSKRHPAGAVGLAAADTRQIPELIQDLFAHYDHYLASAEQFANSWREKHAPVNTLSILQAHNRNSVD